MKPLCCLLLLVVTLSLHAEMRIWTGKNGASLQAELFREDADSVTLRRVDQTTVTIAKANLSTADQEYLQALKQPPLAKPSVNPTDPATTPAMVSPPANLQKGLVFASMDTPEALTLKRVPVVKQFGAFCVPASAEMIARYHNLRVNQTQLARYSSADSFNNRGTYSEDMANAMEGLGFAYEVKRWGWKPDKPRDPIPKNITEDVFPFIFRALHNCGPLYTSFKPGVFGDMGHGCVIIGYDRKREQFYLHNPWGNKFTKSFAEIARECVDVVAFQKAPRIAGDGRVVAEGMARSFPSLPAGTMPEVLVRSWLDRGINASLQLNARRDQRHQRGGVYSWGVAQGFRMISVALDSSLVVLMPNSDEQGRPRSWLMLYRDPDPESIQVYVRSSSASGWATEKPASISELTSVWATRVSESEWDLPLVLIETPPVK